MRTFVKYMTGGLILLNLASCGDSNGTDVVEYICENGKKLKIEWRESLVDVKTGDADFQLPQAISASGARYTDDLQEIWEHQGEVRWSDAGKNVTYCRVTDEES